MQKSIRAIIVDDEELGRSNLRSLLSALDRWEVVAEAEDGAAAVAAVQKLAPDALFLDIDMPRMNGMEAACRLLERGDHVPYMIFVTAYSEYAVQAFEVNAVDYLLKPIRGRRFREAIARVEAALDRRQSESLQDRVATVVGRLSGDGHAFEPYLQRIAVRSVGRVRFVDIGGLLWISASGNYVELHLESGVVLHRQTLASLLQQLDPAQFIQVHRSAIVNCRAVAEFVSSGGGGFALRLRNGDEVPVSETHRAALKRKLGLTAPDPG